MPPMPTTIPINGSVGPSNITTTTTIRPGVYGNVILTGGTNSYAFRERDTIVFKSIKNSGSTNNNFVFDFKGVAGNFIIHVVKRR